MNFEQKQQNDFETNTDAENKNDFKEEDKNIWKHKITPENFKLLKSIFEFLAEDTPEDEVPRSDVIFVFGHVDKAVAEHAAKLFFKKKADKILVTGGIGTLKRLPPGFANEADYFEDVLLKNGVPQDVIIKEQTATNTPENVAKGMEKIKEANLDSQQLILVSMPILCLRSNLTFKKQFPEIKTFNSTFDATDDQIAGGLITKISRVVAEIDRLIEYSEKGDIEKANIPQNILDAHKVLKEIYK